MIALYIIAAMYCNDDSEIKERQLWTLMQSFCYLG